MDGKIEKDRPTQQAAGGLVWKLIALLAIGLASWTVKTTFGPERYRYHSFSSGDYQRIIQVEAATGEIRVIFPRPRP